MAKPRLLNVYDVYNLFKYLNPNITSNSFGNGVINKWFPASVVRYTKTSFFSFIIDWKAFFWCAVLQVNYVKRSSFEFLNSLQFSLLLLQFKKLHCKSLEEICNVAKSQLNFPQFLLKVLNFLLQVPNFLFCFSRCNWLTKIIDQ
jgi:hypothetical protein